MKTNYKLLNNELSINFNFFYDFYDNYYKLSNIKRYINNLIKNKHNIKYLKKIIIYINNIYYGTFYIVNYYFKKKIIELNNTNNFFVNNNYIEIKNN